MLLFQGADASWKASVATAAALPTSGNKVGDKRTALDNFDVYVWNGTSWVTSGGGGGGSSYLKQVAPFDITGTSSVSGTAVTGTGTQFTKELNPGDMIYWNPFGGPNVILSIASDTSLTLCSAGPTGGPWTTTCIPAALVVSNSAGTQLFRNDGVSSVFIGPTAGITGLTETGTFNGVYSLIFSVLNSVSNAAIGTTAYSLAYQSIYFHYWGDLQLAGGGNLVTLDTYGLAIACLAFTPAVSYTPTGTTQSIDWSKSNYFILNLGSASGNVTLSYANVPTAGGAGIVIEVVQGSGSRTVSLPSGSKYKGGTAYSASLSSGSIDKIVISTKNGTEYLTDFGNGYA